MPDQRLDSWKDIAAYLKRDVSTVQRWEKREGMPVHRHQHDKLGSVYAFTSELDAWAEGRRPDPARPENAEPEAEVVPAAPPARPRAMAGILIVAIAIAIAVAALWWWRRSTAPLRTNPIASARFDRLTDFDGSEHGAAISRDGRFVAFLSDRDGGVDVWLTQVGSGQFRNLTGGKLRELVNPDIRMLGFTPDGTQVTIWVRAAAGRPSDISIWAVPILGGEPRLFLEGAAELDWSHDSSQLVFHTPAPGDPMFVRDETTGDSRRLYTAAAGTHSHYPIWSPDDQHVYFVLGPVPAQQDVWRIDAGGGTPERMTSHNTRVSHLTFLDRRTLLYLATDADGGGPWLYALDVARRQTRRISMGVERYTSLSGSVDGRRLAVTVADSRRTLWRVPIGAGLAEESAAERITLPIVGGRSPRAGADYLLYVSSRTGSESIWKFANGTAAELWTAPGARVVGGPAISPDGKRVAFTAEQQNAMRLYTMNADGSALRALPESLAPRGAPAWSPDGKDLAVAARDGDEDVLVRIRLADQKSSIVRREFAADPLWSGDGIVYSGPEVGTKFPIRVAGVDGQVQSRREILLSRGVRRVALLPGSGQIVVLHGDIVHKNFWAIDLTTGVERQLTNFGPDVIAGDFDITPDGRAIVFDRQQDTSDVVLIER